MKIVSKNKTKAIAVHDGHPFVFDLESLEDPNEDVIGAYLDDNYQSQFVEKNSHYAQLFTEIWSG